MEEGFPKFTRVVATIGPASNSVYILKKMLRAGMNVCRLNFSHGSYTDHAALINNIRKASKETGISATILQDLSGPKLRVGDVGIKGVLLKKGTTVVLSSDPKHPHAISVAYPYLERDVKKGDHILLDDGLLELEMTGTTRYGIECKVIVGGLLKSHKGVNLPGSKLSISSITHKDKKDLQFGLKNQVDVVALSFVRSSHDVKELTRLVKKMWDRKKGVPPFIVAKIEKQEALDNFEGILKETDGVMVARGDLGVETPAADVPVHQKTIIAACREAQKPVIVATEMLGSMISKPRPTRAEVSDVANAVIDHTDAVMLSGESATGEYPVEAVSMMASIAKETENSVFDDVGICGTDDVREKTPRGVGALVKILASRGDIRAIMIPPDARQYVSQVAYFRPGVSIIVGSPSEREARQLQLFWGTHSIVAHNETQFFNEISSSCSKLNLKKSDCVAKLSKKWVGYEIDVVSLHELCK